MRSEACLLLAALILGQRGMAAKDFSFVFSPDPGQLSDSILILENPADGVPDRGEPWSRDTLLVIRKHLPTSPKVDSAPSGIVFEVDFGENDGVKKAGNPSRDSTPDPDSLSRARDSLPLAGRGLPRELFHQQRQARRTVRTPAPVSRIYIGGAIAYFSSGRMRFTPEFYFGGRQDRHDMGISFASRTIRDRDSLYENRFNYFHAAFDYRFAFHPAAWADILPGISIRSLELEFNGDAEHRYEFGPSLRAEAGGARIRAFTEAKLFFGSGLHYALPIAGLRLSL